MAVNITGLSSEAFSNIVEEVGTNVIITNNKIVGYRPNIHSKTNAAVAVQEYTEDQNDVGCNGCAILFHDEAGKQVFVPQFKMYSRPDGRITTTTNPNINLTGVATNPDGTSQGGKNVDKGSISEVNISQYKRKRAVATTTLKTKGALDKNKFLANAVSKVIYNNSNKDKLIISPDIKSGDSLTIEVDGQKSRKIEYVRSFKQLCFH
jgi:hypothetical protein